MNPVRDQSAPASEGWRFIRNIALYLLFLSLLCLVVQTLVMGQVRYHFGAAAWMTVLKRDWVRDGWIKFPEGKTGVVAIGDSRMLAAFSPQSFDSSQNEATRSYNLALPASTSETHVAVLKELLASGATPDWLIVALSPNSPARPDTASYRSIGVKSPAEVGQVIRSNPEWRKIVLDWLLPMRRFQKEFVAWLNRVVFSRNQLIGRQTASRNLRDGLDERRGMFVNPEILIVPPAEAPAPNYLNIDGDSDPASRELLALAVEHGIQVIMVSTPIRSAELLRTPETEDEARKIAAGLSGVVFLPEYFDPMVLPNDHFSDLVHLNNRGSVEFSSWLSRKFTDLRAERAHDSIP